MNRPKHKNSRGFLDQLAKLVEFAWSKRDEIAGGVSSAMSFLGPLLLASPQSNEDEYFVRVSYIRAIEHMNQAAVYFQEDDSMQEVIAALRA
jgi:hypothetical protein